MSTRPIIIAFSGLKSTGKSTAANFIESYLKDYVIHRLSFAAPLKKMITDIFCLHNNECYDPNLKDVILDHWNVSPRELMQKIGTDLFRNQLSTVCSDLTMPAETIWASNVYCKIKEIEFNNITNNITNSVIIIDDCRFDDEYKVIKNLGGIVIKIKTHRIPVIPISRFNRSSLGRTPPKYNRNIIKRSSAMRDSAIQPYPIHESEHGCKCDYEVYNNKTIEIFHAKLSKLIEKTFFDQNIKISK